MAKKMMMKGKKPKEGSKKEEAGESAAFEKTEDEGAGMKRGGMVKKRK